MHPQPVPSMNSRAFAVKQAVGSCTSRGVCFHQQGEQKVPYLSFSLGPFAGSCSSRSALSVCSQLVNCTSLCDPFCFFSLKIVAKAQPGRWQTSFTDRSGRLDNHFLILLYCWSYYNCRLNVFSLQCDCVACDKSLNPSLLEGGSILTNTLFCCVGFFFLSL